MAIKNVNKTVSTGKTIVISERDNIAALVSEGRVIEFFIHRGDMLLGDVYLATVENILPSIDAAFVNLGADRMGFLHASDVPGKGDLKERLTPKQKILVQIMKEPTGHKGPRVSTALSLPGRFLVLMPEEKGISISRKVLSPKERSRLKSIVNLVKPPGIGVIIRTEAENQTEDEIKDDLETLLEKWKNIVTSTDVVSPPSLIHRDQDLLYRVIREACTDDIKEIFIDTPFGQHRVNQLIQTWNLDKSIKVSVYKGSESLLTAKGIDKEIKAALQTKVNIPSGGYLYIQQTEALTVVDVNSGKFTSSQTQGETIRQTNLEAVEEIARQLRLRNIGGMIIVDFIDMESRVDQLSILEAFELALEPDKSKPQVGQLSDLGLVELTRHRQGQSLIDIFTKKCPACSGAGVVIEDLNFAPPSIDLDLKARIQKAKLVHKPKMLQQAPVAKQQEGQKLQRPIQKPLQQKMDLQQTVKREPHKLVKPEIQQPKVKPKPKITIEEEDKTPEPVSYSIIKTVPNVENIMFGTLRKVYKDKKFYPEISRTTRFSSIPLKSAKEKFSEEVNMIDVFTILGELEAAFTQASATVFDSPPTAVFESDKPVVKEEPAKEDEEKFQGRYGVSFNGENFEELYEVIDDDELEKLPSEKTQEKLEKVEVKANKNKVETEESDNKDEEPDDTEDKTATKTPTRRGRKPASEKKKRGRPRSK